MMNFFEKFLDVVPRVEYFPEYDPTGTHNGISCAGIKVLAYDGADYDDQHTKVFAHVGFPDDRKGPVPAIVLIHGGGGHPEDIWIKKWNARGYAAISMDTTGFFPTKPFFNTVTFTSAAGQFTSTSIASGWVICKDLIALPSPCHATVILP